MAAAIFQGTVALALRRQTWSAWGAARWKSSGLGISSLAHGVNTSVFSCFIGSIAVPLRLINDDIVSNVIDVKGSIPILLL